MNYLIGYYKKFLSEIIAEVEADGFDMTDFSQVDHLCYRVETIEDYEEKKQKFTAIGNLLTETQVNERPICIFKLHEPIKIGQWRIDALELPAPKPGREESEGLEHIEFVLFDSIEDFLKKYKSKKFKLSAADRGVNPEVGYKLPSGRGVKFHLIPLTAVAYLEEKLGIESVKDGESSMAMSAPLNEVGS